MKNSIRKRKYRHKSLNKNDFFLYNVSSIGIIIEVLIGAILGIAICYGFLLSFIVFGGNLLFSIGVFLTILIMAVFLILLFKYIFVSILIKIQEIEILDKIYKKF